MYEEDAISKEKYVRLLNKLRQIKREMDTTSSVLKDIFNICKDTVLVDNKCVENDLFNQIKDRESRNIISVSNTISKIQNKI